MQAFILCRHLSLILRQPLILLLLYSLNVGISITNIVCNIITTVALLFDRRFLLPADGEATKAAAELTAIEAHR